MAKKRIVNIFKEHEPIWKYVKGTGNWNSIIEPDDYDKWSVNLSGEEVEELEGELQGALDEAVDFAKEEGKVVSAVADLFKVNKDGKKYIQFKRPKYDEDTEGPKLFNISGDEITGQLKKEPGGGSTLRVRAMIKPYYMGTTKTVGLTYKLLAVQVIESKEYAAASGFEDESGGDKPPFDDTPDTPQDY